MQRELSLEELLNEEEEEDPKTLRSHEDSDEDSLPGQRHPEEDPEKEPEEEEEEKVGEGGWPTISASTETTSSGVPTRPPTGMPECWRPMLG